MNTVRIEYDDRVTRQFLWASVVFGVVGMLAGVWAATELVTHHASSGLSFLNFGRLRPLHTNAVIFAFVGNMLFAGIYYSTQRLVKARMASDRLSQIHFWGWQAIILCAAITLPLGITQSREYAELEWPIDIAIAVVWVVFAINFFWTLAVRREKNLYVAIWFYIATIVTVAVLHIFNNLVLPFGLFASYPVFSGVQDALVQWWYGHNAVAFFLTTPILGIMYYYLPKAAQRPVYSYRLSLVHFWSLIFVYIWAGPHHLLYTALPDWAQSLGMLFSVMLWAPSWGGMLNGLLTMKGAWNKLRDDPILKFLIAGVTFYGMATFEGPLLAIKSVNALGHYTDWIIGHVHEGALGWNGFMAAGMFYWLVPRLYGTKLRSKAAADFHFWIGTLGLLLYLVSMWVGGITQGLMLRATTAEGALQYPSFLETLAAIKVFFWMRLLGGTLYLGGFLLMGWNLLATARSGAAVNGGAEVLDAPKAPSPSARQLLLSKPIVIASVLLVLVTGLGLANLVLAAFFLVLIGMVVVYASIVAPENGYSWHHLLEGKAFLFTGLTLAAVLVGGVAEILPTITVKAAVPVTGVAQRPYTALEPAGRDLYVRDGCYVCHSQMVRSLATDTLRYGSVSRAEEFLYDRPFQWGSKRTGPDLHRIGSKYSNLWQYLHLIDPRATSPGSNMPSYAFLKESQVDLHELSGRLAVLRALGTPYSDTEVAEAAARARKEANLIVADLAKQETRIAPDAELVALIGYLQAVGRNHVPPPPGAAPAPGAPPAPSAAPSAEAPTPADPAKPVPTLANEPQKKATEAVAPKAQ
ncbi:MAG: cytochrome-c oxidase, cbb3-type subunit I [Deltaproteobacteria bacterium]|nr:cytochrome-c oxidase, cbb3-type subunit I [Deltaproteobacteria bacterium]